MSLEADLLELGASAEELPEHVEAYLFHIPRPSAVDQPWVALCGVPMPPEHLAVIRRGPVVVCDTCANVFRTLRARRPQR